MKKEFFILMAILLLIMSKNIYAQENKKTKSLDLGAVTVTASRIERELSEVSSSVSIITEREIEDSNAKSIPELLENLEGIYTYDSSGVGITGRINMRGFWGGMSTHQLVLIDGIPQNKGKDKLVDWDLIPLDNIERIEIVRGPVSALYGDNAMSGVINIITRKPNATLKTKTATSYRSFNTQNYKVSTSGLSNKLRYYFNVSKKLTDGFRRHSDYEVIHLNGKLDFLLEEEQNLKISLDYHEKDRGPHPWALTEAQIEQDRRQARPGVENDGSESKKAGLGITYAKNIGENSDVQGIFYYRDEDEKSFYTSGSTGGSTREQLAEEDTYGLLIRLNTNPEFFGMENSFTTGIDLEKNEVDYQEYAAPYQVKGAVRKDYRVKRVKIGPYLQNEIRIFDPVNLILGLRYDSVKFDFTDRKVVSNSEEKNMSKVTPKYGVVYTYQDSSNVYANYAQAFRTPTIGQMFTYGSFSNSELDPEEAVNYEIGVRHQFNEYLKTNVSLYQMKLDNEIWYDAVEKRYKNYGKTSHKGIETRLDFTIIKGLDGFANYTYTRAKNESGSYEGKYLTNIPIHKGSFGIKHETDFGLKTALIITRFGDSYIDSANEDKLSSYTTVDTKVSYEHKWWSVFLAVDNLLNKKYNSYGYKKSSGVKCFSPAPRRTFTFGTTAEF